MAAEGVNGTSGPSLDGARLALLSNSTKRRTNELYLLNEKLERDGEKLLSLARSTDVSTADMLVSRNHTRAMDRALGNPVRHPAGLH